MTSAILSKWDNFALRCLKSKSEKSKYRTQTFHTTVSMTLWHFWHAKLCEFSFLMELHYSCSNGNALALCPCPRHVISLKNELEMIWMIGVFDWVFFVLAGDLPICKNCKWQIGHPFVSLNGVSSSGDDPFLFNFVREFRATMCSVVIYA